MAKQRNRKSASKRPASARSSSSRPASRGSSGSTRGAGRTGLPPKAAAAIRPATARDWISGARLRTLPLAVAPVALGTACAWVYADVAVWRVVTLAVLALLVAVFLQIGANFVNDYSDGIRGTDRVRVGPARLTGSGAARPRTVLTVALVFFALAGAAGVAAVVVSGHWWLLALGAVAFVAAALYTGGPKPYGYHGLGEIMAFVFFGVVATAGTMYLIVGGFSTNVWLAGAAIGSFASATLLVNNVRDIRQDAAAGKRTLAVLLGRRASRVLFAVLSLMPYALLAVFSIAFVYAPFVYFALVLTVPAIVIAVTARSASELVLALRLTTFAALAFGLGLAAAIAF